ncbi:MAG: hypothetical protein V7754_13115 [Halioglobus sp.]
MEYLIIIFVVALALAPLSHFVPNKQQRKVARLREYAALNGLFVEFREVPGADALAVVAGTPHTIYYGKRVRARQNGPQSRLVWRSTAEGWIGRPRRLSVPEELSSLPTGLLAASADQDSCGVYWQERGDEGEIDRICAVLDALVANLYQ